MAEQIFDGRGRGNGMGVDYAGRAATYAVTEPIASERSRAGKTFGIGTGGLTLPGGFSGPVLWFRNDDPDNDMYVEKLIFGWNGGSTNYNRTVFSLIFYNTSIPTSVMTDSNFQVENIKFASGANPGLLALSTGFKWDGTGSVGMVGSSGGFAQIPNRLAQGNTLAPIEGQIILGQGDTMRLDATPEEGGLYQVSVVIYLLPPGGLPEVR